MKESKLETTSKKPTIFKKIDNFLFKLSAYFIDGIPFYSDESLKSKGIYSNFSGINLYNDEDSKLL